MGAGSSTDSWPHWFTKLLKQGSEDDGQDDLVLPRLRDGLEALGGQVSELSAIGSELAAGRRIGRDCFTDNIPADQVFIGQ